jgi:hypothetical protein
MSKKAIAPADIEQTLATTSAGFSQTLRTANGPVIHWDELDLRQIEGKDKQIAAIKKWGKPRSVKIRTD